MGCITGSDIILCFLRAGELDHEVAAAFSHFSFAHSGGASMVCDLQGVGTTWTDVQV